MWPRRDSAPRSRIIRSDFRSCAAALPRALRVAGNACAGAGRALCRGTELTYRALDQRDNQFANHVRNSGAAPEALVAVVLPQGLDQIAAIIGVLKAGAAYVPIDPSYPSYPASRIRHMLDDARPHVTIDEEVVAVVDRWCAERADGVAGLAELDAGNAAYVIYTSGSTGVVIEHGSLVRYLAWTTVAYRGTRGVSVVPT